MTTTQDPLGGALDRIGGQQGQRLEAVVAVEQARAVAQVAAQVQVAQQFPRDLDRVREELAAAVQSHDLAAVSFYSLPNRGAGLTVHLARELAVIWGNVDYGVHELRRDDAAGMSEVQAFCWDMQRNSKATRTFQVPHAITSTKDAKGRKVAPFRQPIIDLQDVYRNNQNAGARAMRECVFATLPRWLVDGAERALRKTLAAGPGKSLPERITEALGWARRVRLTQQQLEQRVGKPVRDWTPEDLAALEVVAASINRGETTTAEQFDEPTAGRVQVSELGDPDNDAATDERQARGEAAAADSYERGPASAAPAEPSQTTAPVGDQRPITPQQITKLILMLNDLDVEGDEAQHAWLTDELHRPITSRKQLTRGEASSTMSLLQTLIDARTADRAEQGGATS
jgi:hypothetical protein